MILSAALLAASPGVAAHAPDGSYRSGTFPEPAFLEDAKLSLITGHLATAHPIGSFPCPEKQICLDAVWDDTFADMETRLGPAINPRAHVRSVHDAGLAGHPIVAYVVKPDKDGQLWALALRVAQNHRACFDRELAEEWPELGSDPRTTESEGEVCFRLR